MSQYGAQSENYGREPQGSAYGGQDDQGQQSYGNEQGSYGQDQEQDPYGQQSQMGQDGYGQQGGQGEQDQWGASPEQNQQGQYGEQEQGSQPGAGYQNGSMQNSNNNKYGQHQSSSQGMNGMNKNASDSLTHPSSQQPKHGGANELHDPENKAQAHAGGQPNQQQWAQSGRNYHHTHHNAVYHMSQAAHNGFTKEHMDSFLHLGAYALGALANTHNLAPSAPHPQGSAPTGGY